MKPMKPLVLEEMTTEQKLGMLYCARLFNQEALDLALELIKKRAIGSVQISPKRKDFVQKVLDAADYPIIIVCDTETRFPTSEKQPIPLVTLAACDKPEYYEVFGKAVATEAKAAGFNATWNPVVDVLHCNGPIKVYRLFSDDPARVCRAAEEICKVYKRNGYMSCGKHYPGGSDAPYDNHMTSVPSKCTVDDLMNFDMIPYKYLMERDLLPSIMTRHAVYENIDPEHAGTMSPKIQGMIREMGWDGVCWTDSFGMMAVLQKYGEENILGLAIAAGNDIVLPNYRTPARVTYGHLLENWERGMFSEERLNESAARVIKLMNKLAEIPEAVDVFTEEDQKLYDSIAAASITAICDEGVDIKLPENTKKMFVITTPMDYNPNTEDLETVTDQWYYPNRIADQIRKNFPDAHIEFIPEFPTKPDNERVLVASTQFEEVIFVTFCDTQPYLGTDGLTRRLEVMIDSLNMANRLSTVVHFGNPFALETIQHVGRKIFGYIMPDAQPCAIDALAGLQGAPGSLPFNCKFQ